MTNIQTRELLYVIGVGLIVIAVIFGGMRHTYNLEKLRAVMEVGSSAHLEDIDEVSDRITNIEEGIEKLRTDELESLRAKLSRIESEEIVRLRVELDALKAEVKMRAES